MGGSRESLEQIGPPWSVSTMSDAAPGDLSLSAYLDATSDLGLSLGESLESNPNNGDDGADILYDFRPRPRPRPSFSLFSFDYH